MNAEQIAAESTAVVHKEGAGVICLSVIRPDNIAWLIVAASAGDREAILILAAAENHAQRVLNGIETADPVPCAACAGPLVTHNAAIVVARAARTDASRAFAMGICKGCAVDDDTAIAKSTEALRVIWPDVRPLTISNQAGRA